MCGENMFIERKITKQVFVGNVVIGGKSEISVQTMTNCKTADIERTLQQIKIASEMGADVVRVTVNDEAASKAIVEIVRRTNVPIVADIHFNHIFALKSIEAGVAKVRINPGNIGSEDRIKAVLDKAKERHIPIRIGVNSGSLEKDILEKYGSPTAEALFESAARHIAIANKFDFDDIVISVKSSSVLTTIEAYRLLSKRTDYPLHIGVTEAGSEWSGTIKSSVALGILLSEGIGDTIRVSLTASPEKEVTAANEILASLGLRKRNIEIVACPTCGRTENDVIALVNELESKLSGIKKQIKIAIMGCVVNGPGEAGEADIAVCCGKNNSLLYLYGTSEQQIRNEEIVSTIINCVEKWND